MINTLLLYIPLLALTDRRTDGETNTLASRGLVEPFFQLCCCVSFLFWREIGFTCTYYYVLRVSYSCGVVFVFLILAGNSFWCYLRTQCTIQLCGCGIFFVVAGKFILYNFFLLNPNFLLVHRKFSSRTYAITPQKY